MFIVIYILSSAAAGVWAQPHYIITISISILDLQLDCLVAGF